MLLIAGTLGIVGGLLAGGRLTNLLSVRLRYGALILLALFLRIATQWLIDQGVDLVDQLRVPLFGLSFGLLMASLWLNRSQPGLLLALIGIGFNGLALIANGGYMPVYGPAVHVVGLTEADLSATFHVLLPDELGLDFLLSAGPFGDILPLAIPFLTNVVSLGDVLLAAGVAWFLFSAIARGSSDPDTGVVSLWRSQPRAESSSGLSAGQVALDRPVVLGGGMGPGLGTAPASAAARRAAIWAPEATVTIPVEGLAERIRRHPYVRLARDARFSAFWLAGTISLFGDRLHQIALGVMVLSITGSALQTGLVFLAATLPNLVLGPVAGTFVDRWDQKLVMIVSDVLRAGLVLVIPFIAETSILLVYPIVFGITTISLFFRPAKAAVVPRIVGREDLMPANGAIWTGETMADIAGYPLAGVFVAFLGTNLALAFWVDSVTYLVSAALLAGVLVPPVVREAAPRVRGAVATFIEELRDGWHFLRGEATLFQNTLVSAVAQLSIGATLALMVVYAERSLDGDVIPYPESYAVIEAAIGLGNLVGGFVVGAIGARLRKGWLVVSGFAVMGLATVVLGLTSNDLLAVAAAVVIGIFNLVYVIPSQTLFAERTPARLMGRVIAMRSSIVMGALTGAMAVSSGLADHVDAGVIIAATGVLTVIAAGLAAALPAVRDA
ncbi:MAG TPA: MFS transporter [Candidatus Limnocylindrales bacterium]|nr:MFS transporter [Candidatus Limnocylindrales bacterium]